MYKWTLMFVLSAGCVWAQTPVQIPALSISTAPVAFAVSGETVKGAPYSADTTTERVQMLADGNRIQQTTTGTVARDSEGRMRDERVLSGISGPGGEAPHIITIHDPVAGHDYTLDSNTKVAFGSPELKALFKGKDGAAMPKPNPAATTEFLFTGTAGPVIAARKLQGSTESEANVVKTDLGAQSMEGVLVEGTRITRTIPAGSVGNEQPIVITTETWYSPDLKVLVMSKSSDPRIGETTYKLTNIQRTEPAPSLFQIPADYTVKQPSDTIFFQKTGGAK